MGPGRANRKLELQLREMAAKYESDIFRANNASSVAMQLAKDASFSLGNGGQDLGSKLGAAMTVSSFADDISNNNRDVLPKDIKGSPPRAAAGYPHPTRPTKATITEGLRQISLGKESQRANEAEAALDIALAKNRELGSMVYALDEFLHSMGYSVEDVCDGAGT